MERHSTSSLRASNFLSLMVLAQAQVSSAYPFAPRINADTGDLEAGPRPHFAPNHVEPPEGINTASWHIPAGEDEAGEHWSAPPVVQIADGQLQVPASKIAEFTAHIGDWSSVTDGLPTPGIFKATEWSTVSTATVTNWPESGSKPAGPPPGEVLTSTVWSTESTATATNWNGPVSESSTGPILGAFTSTIWNTVATETVTNQQDSASSPAAALTTSESTLPPTFEAEQSNTTSSLASNTSTPLALEITMSKTYSRSRTASSNSVQLEQGSQTVPLFADATSSNTVQVKAKATADAETEVDASASPAAVTSSSHTSPIVYGSITLTYTTHTDTTTGFPATAETVNPVVSSSSSSTVDFYNPFPPSSSSSSSTVDFYNPFPPSTTQDSNASATTAAASLAVDNGTESAVQNSDTRESPVFYSEPTSDAASEGTAVEASATPLANTASAAAMPDAPPLSVPDVSLKMLSTSAVQTAPSSAVMNNEGYTSSVPTTLNMDGRSSAAPFPTSVVASSVTLSLNDTAMMSNVVTSTKLSLSVTDIFQAIATDEPPAQVTKRNDHPVPRKGIQPQEKKLQTNKFYANFLLDDQAQPAYVFPYSVFWGNGTGATGSYGMAVSHTERQQFAGGETDPVTGAWKFYASPIRLESLVLSSTELGSDTKLTTDTLEGFSVNVNLSPSGSDSSRITYPLVQGMSMFTACYTNSTPVIASGPGFDNITYIGAVGDNATHKYRMELSNGFSWLAYVTPENTDYDVNRFTLLNNSNTVQGPSGFQGTIQVAKIPAETSDAVNVYDGAAGAYPTSGSISGSVDGTTGKYTLSWQKGGVQSQKLLMFALPHHMQSLSDETKGGVTDVKLMTTVKGNSVAVRGDSWTLVEKDLPIDMEFAPYQPGHGSIRSLSSDARALVNEAASSELQQDMDKMSNLDSMYYSGKELAKFASIVFAVNDMAQNASLAQGGLERLKTAMGRFVDNKQQFPLVYDESWGGASSSASYDGGNSGQDFGNTLYNDHHFHYGYHVYAASVIAYLDPSWLETGSNKAWVNMLARDYANPISDDPWFPFSRNFDFYQGHSWAKGLFASADGKDQESSSEDTMASYAIKMWGSVTGDKAMEARGNLMLAIQARSLDNYYLYRDSNEVQPKEYIGNRAAGILFENKIDHTTYFGSNIEYIQGINMIPIMPFSTVTRRRDFVQTEWDQFFAKNISSVASGWRGILMANRALIDPNDSYNFFANQSGDFKSEMLDGGASRTWYLAYAAGLKSAEDAGYESPSSNSTISSRSVEPIIPRPTKRWVDGELVDCDESNQADMEAGVLKMYGELDQATASTPKGKRWVDGQLVHCDESNQADMEAGVLKMYGELEKKEASPPNGKRWVDGQLVDCDESNQADMEAGVLKMYGELDSTNQQQASVPQEPAEAEAPRVARRNRIGTSGSPRLRQRARG